MYCDMKATIRKKKKRDGRAKNAGKKKGAGDKMVKHKI